MSEFCRGGQGFLCEGQNGSIAIVLKGNKSFECSVFLQLGSNCISLVQDQFHSDFRQDNGVTEEKNPVVCLSLGSFTMPMCETYFEKLPSPYSSLLFSFSVQNSLPNMYKT